MELADLLEILITADVEPDKYPRKKTKVNERLGTARADRAPTTRRMGSNQTIVR